MNPANNTPDINFIPQEIVDRRLEVRSRSTNNKFAIFIAVVAAIASGVAFYFNNSLATQIQALDAKINDNNSKVTDLQEFGKHGYKLGIRLQNAQTIINNRSNYSYLMDELRFRMPGSVEIDSFTVKEGIMTFKGITRSGYTVIADFQDSLLANRPDGKNLFSDVKLKASNFNKSSGVIEFTMEINISGEIKKEKE